MRQRCVIIERNRSPAGANCERAAPAHRRQRLSCRSAFRRPRIEDRLHTRRVCQQLVDGARCNISFKAAASTRFSRQDRGSCRWNRSTTSVSEEYPAAMAINDIVTVFRPRKVEMWLFMPAHPNLCHALVGPPAQSQVASDDVESHIFSRQHFFEVPDYVGIFFAERHCKNWPFDIGA